ncbi:methyl-accepting chemotaxis protein [Leeia sp.]|uniref:methyl-accepting chemotaxis protein n=1 Tax=Leeia sp. TaxID=2884678 RepID=UPI0035AE8A56
MLKRHIASRLYLLGGCLLLLIVLTGLISLYNMRAINQDFASTYNDRVVPLKQLKVVADMYAVNIVDTTHKLRNGNLNATAAQQSIETARATIAKEWQAYRSTYLTPDEARLASEADTLMKQADTSISQLLGLIRQNNAEAVAQYAAKNMYPVIDPVSGKISELIDLQLREAQRLYQDGEQQYQRTLTISIGLLLAAIAISLLLSRWIARSIVGPLKAAVHYAQTIAQGDLSALPPAASQDETGQLLTSLGVMRQQLHALVEQISSLARQLNDQSRHMGESVNHAVSATDTLDEATSSIAAAVEQSATSIAVIKDNATHAREGVQATDTAAQHALTRVGDMHLELERLSHSIQDSAQQVHTLAESSTEINGMVKVIASIAEQTNLLALNASIEAARAGEMGRGFAVVADEVRKLAEHTATATSDITQVVSRITQQTGQTVERMQNNVRQVKATMETATTTREQLNAIGSHVQAALSSVSEITIALQEQVQANHLVAQDTERVADMSSTNLSTLQQASATSHALEQQSTSLLQAVQRFQLSTH